MTIGERIKLKRIELGMSQEELAIKCGYKSRSSINKIELSRDLPLSKVEVVAKSLGVAPAYIMGWEEEIESTELVDSCRQATEYAKEKESHYISEETQKIAQEIYESKELSLLFDAARDATPQDLLTVHTMLVALKQKENGEGKQD